jgi:hypothetical protein
MEKSGIKNAGWGEADVLLEKQRDILRRGGEVVAIE